MNKYRSILDILEVYFKDPEKCAIDTFDFGTCKYETLDGRMCAFGAAMLPKMRKIFKDKKGSALWMLNNKGGEEALLKEEYRGLLRGIQWNVIQSVHDALAKTYSGIPRLQGEIWLSTLNKELLRGILDLVDKYEETLPREFCIEIRANEKHLSN